MTSDTIRLIEEMKKIYEKMSLNARDEQDAYMIKSPDYEGYVRVDPKSHAEWARAITKEAVMSQVVEDLDQIIMQILKLRMAELDDFKNRREHEGKSHNEAR
jgi:reverse gyrase